MHYYFLIGCRNIQINFKRLFKSSRMILCLTPNIGKFHSFGASFSSLQSLSVIIISWKISNNAYFVRVVELVLTILRLPHNYVCIIKQLMLAEHRQISQNRIFWWRYIFSTNWVFDHFELRNINWKIHRSADFRFILTSFNVTTHTAVKRPIHIGAFNVWCHSYW